MRVQLIVPENTLIQPEIFDRSDRRFGASTSSSSADPAALGLIGYIVPLQIGARGVALPRLNQLSYWLYLAGAVTLHGSFLYRPPPRPGRSALPPLSTTSTRPPTAPTPGSPASAWRSSASSASRST